MRIGFDAKRAFYNRSGLGNYSRNVIKALVHDYPEHEYFLYTPKFKNHISFVDSDRYTIGLPTLAKGKIFSSFWRSFLLTKRIKKDRIDIYHGLSNELPANIHKSGAKTVVTIHDLIFIRHPEWYKPIDRKIYERKFRYSSQCADKVIAASEQTKSDLIEYFGISAEKIAVIYQGCNDIFMERASSERISEIKKKYGVPEQYILFVGTIEERKNLLQVIKAMQQANIDFPLVAIGKPTRYLDVIKSFIAQNDMKGVSFLHNVPLADLPAFYQGASLFIYPSRFEGFGIPILEALWSKIPVITSKGGCFSEVGGEFSKYVAPENTSEMANAIKDILTNKRLIEIMINNGFEHAQQFTAAKSARQIMDLYNSLIHG